MSINLSQAKNDVTDNLHTEPDSAAASLQKTGTSKNITAAEWNALVLMLAYLVKDNTRVANAVKSVIDSIGDYDGTESTLTALIEALQDYFDNNLALLREADAENKNAITTLEAFKDTLVTSLSDGHFADLMYVVANPDGFGLETLSTVLAEHRMLTNNVSALFGINAGEIGVVENADKDVLRRLREIETLIRSGGILSDVNYDADTYTLSLTFVVSDGSIPNIEDDDSEPDVMRTIKVDLSELVDTDEIATAIANLNMQNGTPLCSLVQKSVPGAENTVTAQHGVAFGASNLVQGWAGVATGHGNQQNSDWGYVGGEYSWLGPNAYASIAFGEGVSLDRRHGAAFGTYNDWHSNAVFAVGNGTSDTSRSNAFEVFEDGSMVLGGVRVTPDRFSQLVTGQKYAKKKGEVSFSVDVNSWSGAVLTVDPYVGSTVEVDQELGCLYVHDSNTFVQRTFEQIYDQNLTSRAIIPDMWFKVDAQITEGADGTTHINSVNKYYGKVVLFAQELYTSNSKKYIRAIVYYVEEV